MYISMQYNYLNDRDQITVDDNGAKATSLNSLCNEQAEVNVVA